MQKKRRRIQAFPSRNAQFIHAGCVSPASVWPTRTDPNLVNAARGPQPAQNQSAFPSNAKRAIRRNPIGCWVKIKIKIKIKIQAHPASSAPLLVRPSARPPPLPRLWELLLDSRDAPPPPAAADHRRSEPPRLLGGGRWTAARGTAPAGGASPGPGGGPRTPRTATTAPRPGGPPPPSPGGSPRRKDPLVSFRFLCCSALLSVWLDVSVGLRAAASLVV
jgi:hypothetical protein